MDKEKEVAEEAKKAIKQIVDEQLAPIADKLKELKNDETIGELTQKYNDLSAKLNNNEIAEVKGLIGELSSQLDKVSAKQSLKGQKVEKFENVNDALVSAFSDKEIDAKIKSIANGGKQTEPIRIEVAKAAVDLTTANTIGAGSTAVTITQNTGIFAPIRQRAEKYLINTSVGSIATNRALWVEETDEQGTPIFIAEGDAKTQLSVKYVEKTQEVQKIAVYGKVTTEMMADTPQLISYIQNNLLKRVGIATENGLMVGDGTGENLKGMKTFATTFAAGALALAIDNANEFDVLEAMALQVEIANGVPNVVFVHPSTLSKMKLIKDTTGVPLWKSYADNQGGISVSGMRLVTSTAVTAGEFFGGDATVANVLFREGLSVQIGLDGNDFINNKKTILVEQRLVQFVSANDTPVLVKGVFSTAKTALETA